MTSLKDIKGGKDAKIAVGIEFWLQNPNPSGCLLLGEQKKSFNLFLVPRKLLIRVPLEIPLIVPAKIRGSWRRWFRFDLTTFNVWSSLGSWTFNDMIRLQVPRRIVSNGNFKRCRINRKSDYQKKSHYCFRISWKKLNQITLIAQSWNGTELLLIKKKKNRLPRVFLKEKIAQ